MMDDAGVDSMPVAIAASLIILAIIVGMAASGIAGVTPVLSSSSVDGQVSMLCNDCRGLLACSPRDLLDPFSLPGASKTLVLSLPTDTGYVAFGIDPGSSESHEGTIYYLVHGNKKAVIVDERARFREGIKKGDAVVPSQRHTIIKGGGRYELTIEYQYDGGLDEKYLVVY
ncbi:hypothetical protein [Methanocella conradii]|uniref:hypothetical protein n=1 Tax=Methanocella conradii TaxID=1175444 RepID=UPI00157D45D6|nr:hypothetical protein [Methanocella conradii]